MGTGVASLLNPLRQEKTLELEGEAKIEISRLYRGERCLTLSMP
jgi:hypothetical protein